MYRIPGPAVVFPKFYYYPVDQSQSCAERLHYYRVKLVEVKVVNFKFVKLDYSSTSLCLYTLHVLL